MERQRWKKTAGCNYYFCSKMLAGAQLKMPERCWRHLMEGKTAQLSQTSLDEHTSSEWSITTPDRAARLCSGDVTYIR